MKLTVDIQPSPFPDPLWIGEPIAVTVGATLENGTGCYTCRVRWRSDHEAIVKWTALGATETVRTGTLQPIAPGKVTLTIDVCPGGGFACDRTVITRNVVRR